MNKLLIIDGHNLLFQMYFGMPNKIYGKAGFSIHGVIGFIGALLKINRMIKPSHIIVIFDSETPNPRKIIDDNYKSNRPSFVDIEDNENPFSNLPLIQKVLERLEIAQYEAINQEADDLIAQLAKSFDGEVYISSSDNDFFQLIDEQTFVLTYRGVKTKIYDSSMVKEKYGIMPTQIADYKAIVGDVSDNIKGVPGIGKITGANLLNQYPSITALYDHLDDLKPKQKELLTSNRDKVFQNYQLVKLDVEIRTIDFQPLLKRPIDDIKTMDILRQAGVI